MPLISVVIPVFNGDRTLADTLRSVLAQTFTDFEVFVINDGSTDRTVEVVQEVSDDRIRLFSYRNAGVNASRNRGIAHASGEFVAFLDADDLWTPDKLDRQLRALQTHPAAAVAYSWTDRIDEGGAFLRRGSYIAATGNVYARLLLLDFLENGSNPLVRRSALDAVGGFDETLVFGEDWELWLRLAARYEFVAVPAVQVLYRTSAQSASAQVTAMEAQVLTVIDRAFCQAPADLQHLKRDSMGNLYKYLTFKALEGQPDRQRSLAALRFLRQAIGCDSRLGSARVTAKVLLRIAIALLSPRLAARLPHARRLLSVAALLGYLRTEP